MQRKKKLYHLATLGMLSLAMIVQFQNCAPAPGGSPQVTEFASSGNKAADESLQADINEIKLLAKQELSCDADTDCVVIEVGARACGGPRSYEFTSSRNSQLSYIHELAANLAEAERAALRESGQVETCILPEPPDVACIARTCSLRAAQ